MKRLPYVLAFAPGLLVLTLFGCGETHSSLKPASLREPRPGIEARETVSALPRTLLRGPSLTRDEFVTLTCVTDENSSPSPLSSLELWKTPDGGASWEVALRASPLSKTIRVPLSPGVWGFRLCPVGKDGNRTPFPRPGDPPQLTVEVDRSPPRITVDSIEVTEVADSGDAELEKFEVTLEYQVADANPSVPACTIRTACGKKGRWRTAAEGKDPHGRISFRIAAFCSPLRVRIRAVDRAGNVGTTEEIVWPEDRVRPPHVRILSPQAGVTLRGGDRVAVRYELSWESGEEKPITFSCTTDSRTWRIAESGLENTGSWTWRVPRGDHAEVRLRMEVKGKSGRTITAEAGPFRVDGTPPFVAVLGPRTFPATQGTLLVKVKDPGPVASGTDRVEVYARLRGEEKTYRVGRSEGAAEKILLRFPRRGVYEVWCVAWDRAGNSSPLPPAGEAFELKVKPVEGALALLTLSEGGVVKQGSTHILAWRFSELEEPPQSGRILLREGDKTRILCEVDPLAGKASVTFPEQAFNDARLELEIRTAGGRRLSAQTKPLASDNEGPSVKLLSGAVEGRKITLTYEARDRGPAGLSRIWAFVSPDGGATWPRRERLDFSGKASLDLGEGLWGIFLAAQDKVGNRTAFPEEGQAPQATFLVGKCPPDTLALVNFRGGEIVRGGSTHFVSWRCRLSGNVMPTDPASLYVSLDRRAATRSLFPPAEFTGRGSG